MANVYDDEKSSESDSVEEDEEEDAPPDYSMSIIRKPRRKRRISNYMHTMEMVRHHFDY